MTLEAMLVAMLGAYSKQCSWQCLSNALHLHLHLPFLLTKGRNYYIQSKSSFMACNRRNGAAHHPIRITEPRILRLSILNRVWLAQEAPQ